MRDGVLMKLFLQLPLTRVPSMVIWASSYLSKTFIPKRKKTVSKLACASTIILSPV